MWVLSHVFGLKLCIAATGFDWKMQQYQIANGKWKKTVAQAGKKCNGKVVYCFLNLRFQFFSCGCFFSHFVYMCFLFFHKVFRFFCVLITLQISSRACKKKNISPKLTQNPQKTLCSATPEFLLCNFLHLYCIIFKLVWLVPECRRAWWPNPFPQHRLKASLRKWPTVSNSFHQRTSRYSKSINRHTIWLFNIAMENHHF